MWTKSLIFTDINVNQKLSMYVLHWTVNIFNENHYFSSVKIESINLLFLCTSSIKLSEIILFTKGK